MPTHTHTCTQSGAALSLVWNGLGCTLLCILFCLSTLRFVSYIFFLHILAILFASPGLLFTFLLPSILCAIKCANLTDAMCYFMQFHTQKMFVRRDIYMNCDGSFYRLLSLGLSVLALLFVPSTLSFCISANFLFIFYLCSN